MQPDRAVDIFLTSVGANVAALRNLRRETIDHEYEWIVSWMCPRSKGRRKGVAGGASAQCMEVVDQMSLYETEQEQQQQQHGDWHTRTVVIEGALLLYDLRSLATQCYYATGSMSMHGMASVISSPSLISCIHRARTHRGSIYYQGSYTGR